MCIIYTIYIIIENINISSIYGVIFFTIHRRARRTQDIEAIMGVFDALQQFLTKPAELLMEVIYAIVLQLSTNLGIPVILLSIAIIIPALRLYRRADAVQSLLQGKKDGAVPHQVSWSLLLEILLFASAYFFFTAPERIWGGSFFLIRNLGKPDALLRFGGIRFNLLPICALVLRIITDRIRLKTSSRSIRIQNLLAAALFFGLSYDRLSGFALYRLAGELILLLSVLFSGRKNFRWIFCIGISVFGPVFACRGLFSVHPELPEKTLIGIGITLLMQIPLAVCLIGRKRGSGTSGGASREDRLLFLAGAVYLTILTGVLIPSTVIRSAPTDFLPAADSASPLRFVFSTFLLAAGTFMFWGGIIYRLAPSRDKRLIAFVMAVISVWGTVNSMFFGNDRGVMSGQLQYEQMPEDTLWDVLINSGILILITLLLVIIWKRKPVLLRFLILVLCITKTVTSAANIAETVTFLSEEREALAEQPGDPPEIPLSRQGKNIVFFMLDRSIGYFVPFMLAERPELAEKFDGFTFYPNTLSFGTHTNEAAPALFGGYEYTPAEINARDDVPLADKHDEALRLLPVLFDEADYEVTVIDPPYAGYLMLSDLDIFSDHPDIRTFRAAGRFSSAWKKQDFDLQTLRRNFFCFSLYRISPLVLQPALYAGGSYNRMNLNQAMNDLFSSQGIQDSFEQEYSVLRNLPAMTKVTDDGKNTYLSITNKTAHEAALLQLPDYTPAETVNNEGLEAAPITRTAADGRTIILDSTLKVTHYHANMASFLLIGEWLDYLRENGVYDNTRIIIAADHGFTLGFSDLEFDSELSEEVLTYNPVLMVKDFGAGGFSVDDSFMTNAEVPQIVLKGLISDPVNPATGKPLTESAGAGDDLLIMHSEEWDIRSNDGNTFLPGRWFRFSGDDIFDPECWEFIETR